MNCQKQLVCLPSPEGNQSTDTVSKGARSSSRILCSEYSTNVKLAEVLLLLHRRSPRLKLNGGKERKH